MTGGGFGGCVVSLVESTAAEAAATSIVREYADRTRIDARWWITQPAAGAGRDQP
jgi:galactokinase